LGGIPPLKGNDKTVDRIRIVTYPHFVSLLGSVRNNEFWSKFSKIGMNFLILFRKANALQPL